MPDDDSQQESFSLANMVPQVPSLNRGVWEGIESAVRDFVRKSGEVYVVTGPIFRGQTLKRINGRVLVPTDIYKAIYDPRRGQAGAYLIANTEGAQWQAISIAQLREISGIDVFPDLQIGIKERVMDLPKPGSHKRGRQRQGGAEDSGAMRPASVFPVDNVD
jgi:endonuclease G